MKICDMLLSPFRKYRDDTRGTISIEFLLAFPMLIWAFVATLIFTDAYRARSQAQIAALHVADLVSRNTQVVTNDYLEGMNDVFDFLNSQPHDTRLRISSIMWDPDAEMPVVIWSYGTRNLASLLELGIHAPVNFGSEDGNDPDKEAEKPAFGFDNPILQLPVADLADRIPPAFPGEALILVEAFTLWRSPIISWMGFDYLDNIRLTPIAVTRPRFSPFIRYEHDNDVFPEDGPEYLPPAGEVDPPVQEPEEPEEPETTTVTIVDTDFTDGDTANWSTDSVSVTHTDISSFLGPFGRETWANPVTYQVNLGETSQSALIEFDLFIIDSWDGYNPDWSYPEGEFLTIRVNGTSIALEAFDVDLPPMMANDRRTVSSRAEGRFTTTMELISSGRNLYGAGWADQVWRVRIEVENPATQFTLGFAARLNEDIWNEAFGLRSFRITAERGAQGAAHFVPNASALLGSNFFTRFSDYSGCPDTRIPSATLTLRNSDIGAGGPTRMLRVAGGVSWARNCGINVADRYNRATPTKIVRYTNDTSNVSGNRLRIRTQDGNRGNSCDASLLIRDPYGDWYYDDAISTGLLLRSTLTSNLNASINLGHARTGEYHIFMGNYSSGYCGTDLVFERY